MDKLPALDRLSEQEKDALIIALWAAVQGLQTRVTELEAKLQEPGKDARIPVSRPRKRVRPTSPDVHRRGRVARLASVGLVVDGPCNPTPTR